MQILRYDRKNEDKRLAPSRAKSAHKLKREVAQRTAEFVLRERSIVKGADYCKGIRNRGTSVSVPGNGLRV